MSAGDSSALQQNTTGDQVFKQSFIVRRFFTRNAGTNTDFYFFLDYRLRDFMQESGGVTSLPNIFQNYKLDKVEWCLHTVDTEGGGGQIWECYVAPWNRPSQCGTGETARVYANLLPGCQWRVFNTHGYAGQFTGNTSERDDGESNEIGIGGALYETQNDPKYFVDVRQNDGNVCGMIPTNGALPTYTVRGR